MKKHAHGSLDNSLVIRIGRIRAKTQITRSLHVGNVVYAQHHFAYDQPVARSIHWRVTHYPRNVLSKI